VSALARLAAAADPALRPHAVSDPGAGELEPLVPDAARALVIEAVREGYLMHYGEPRVFAAADPDLRLLAGDSLFALGLARLAEGGDLEAVAALADLISASAQAESEGRCDGVRALWRSTAEALGRERPDPPTR
jgi:hypothetical protein